MFVRLEQMTTVTIIITRSEATADIARIGGHYAVQGHSRSLIHRYQSKARMRLPISLE